MIDELRKLRELTETLTGNGYLRDQAEEWEYALDAIPDYVYIINTRFEIKFVNKAFSKRLSMPKTSLYGRLFSDVVYGYKTNEELKGLEFHNIDSSYVHLKNVFIESLDGWFDISKSPIHTKTKKLIGFICVLQDVTEKKFALDHLQKEEATMELILDAAPVGIGLIDRHSFKIISVNKFLMELTGYNAAELVDQPYSIFFPSSEDFEKVISCDPPQDKFNKVGSVEAHFRTKDAKILWVLIRFGNVRDSSNVVFTVTDISTDEKVEMTDGSFWYKFC